MRGRIDFGFFLSTNTKAQNDAFPRSKEGMYVLGFVVFIKVKEWNI